MNCERYFHEALRIADPNYVSLLQAEVKVRHRLRGRRKGCEEVEKGNKERERRRGREEEGEEGGEKGRRRRRRERKENKM